MGPIANLDSERAEREKRIAVFAMHCVLKHSVNNFPDPENVVESEIKPLQACYKDIFGEDMSKRGVIMVVLRGAVMAHPTLADTFFYAMGEPTPVVRATLHHLGVRTFPAVVGRDTVTCWHA